MSKIEQKMRERYEKRAETKEPKHRSSYAREEPKKYSPVAGSYKLIFVKPGGALKFGSKPEAPAAGAMLNRAKQLGALFAIRYWPSRKGWRVLDVRTAQCFDKPNGHGGTYPDWTGYRYLDTLFPNEDAAVMAAMALAAA